MHLSAARFFKLIILCCCHVVIHFLPLKENSIFFPWRFSTRAVPLTETRFRVSVVKISSTVSLSSKFWETPSPRVCALPHMVTRIIRYYVYMHIHTTPRIKKWWLWKYFFVNAQGNVWFRQLFVSSPTRMKNTYAVLIQISLQIETFCFPLEALIAIS
jgi:hypothetical protein